jgi:hypothetical protein
VTTIEIDIRLIAEVEELACIDCEPGPEVVAPLMARADALRAEWRDPELDDDLCADVHKALDPYGSYLNIAEIHSVQRLRGWHRVKYGTVAVDLRWFTEVRHLLSNLAMGTDSDCENELRSMCHPGEWDLHAASIKRMITDGTCGECKWCWTIRLLNEFDDARGTARGAA